MQAGFDFAVDLNPERKEPDFLFTPVYTFEVGPELIITDTLSWLREVMTLKEYNGFYTLLSKHFDRGQWSGHDLNKICHHIYTHRIKNLHALIQVVASYSARQTIPSFFSRPYAHLLFRYGLLKKSNTKAPAPWKQSKLTQEIIPQMHEHGAFGNPGSLKAEFFMEEEIQAL